MDEKQLQALANELAKNLKTPEGRLITNFATVPLNVRLMRQDR